MTETKVTDMHIDIGTCPYVQCAIFQKDKMSFQYYIKHLDVFWGYVCKILKFWVCPAK